MCHSSDCYDPNTFLTRASLLSDAFPHCLRLGGKSSADKGKYNRDYFAAAFTNLNARSRAVAKPSSSVMFDAGFAHQYELTKIQLYKQK